MALKQEYHIIKGMTRDLTVSKFNPEFAYECKNIRITARDNGTLLSVTNERGNTEIPILSENSPIQIQGNLIGYNVLNNYVTLFTSSNRDRIYRLENKQTYFEGKLLYEGDLNFSTNNPIETLGVYENDNIQKVYWVDGLNQPRVINIMADTDNFNSNSFDFVKELQLNETASVNRIDNASGEFSPGVIQYAFSYYNKYGSQSNIFYTTPLYYIAYPSRGASPEDKVACNFRITINNTDSNFEYIRVYAIQRTSIDATPSVRNVIDIANSESVTVTDTGVIGSSIDPSELLYIGGEDIVASTMCQKDNTVFLGNITLSQLQFTPEEEADIRSKCILSFAYKELPYVEPTGFYPYENQLNLSSEDIRGFKGGETYRVSIQFQYKNGKYSAPVFLKDITNTLYPKIQDGKLMIPMLSCSTNGVSLNGYKKARLLIAVPTNVDRSVLCQGVISPTIYNMADRYSNTPFSSSSWFMRVNSFMSSEPDNTMEYRHNNPLPSNSYRNSEIQSTINPSPPYVTKEDIVPTTLEANFYYYIIQGTLKQGFVFYLVENNVETYRSESYTYEAAKTKALNYMDEGYIPQEDDWRRATSTNPIKTTLTQIPPSESLINKFVGKEAENFYVDQSILTMHSPDIENYINDLDNSSLKMRIVGISQITSSMSDYNIITSTPVRDLSCIGQISYNTDQPNLSKKAIGLISAPLWNDSIGGDNSYKTLFATYPWHRSGSMNADGIPASGETRTANLSRKIFSNLRYSYITKYFSTPWESYIEGNNNRTGITNVSIFNSNENELIRIPKPLNSNLEDLNYGGNMDRITTYNSSKNNDGYPIQCVGRLYGDSIYGSVDAAYVPVEGVYGKDPVSIKYKSTPHAVFAFNYTKQGQQNILPALNNADKFSLYDGNKSMDGSVPWDAVSTGVTTELQFFTTTLSPPPTGANKGDLWYADEYGRIQENTGGNSWITLVPVEGSVWKYNNTYYKMVFLHPSDPLDKDCELVEIDSNIYQDVIGEDSEYPFLYIAELYRDIDLNTIYGGTSESALLNNQWIPVSKTFNIGSTISGKEGDTFFQRYDCLKTYAYTSEDKNSLVDITSFMCESRMNLDGRYDRNRGQTINLAMSPTNFNLFNPVYNQSNNFFNYRKLDKKFTLNYFPNTITWSKEKQFAEDIDTWTNINVSSTLDLDGDKGEVISLNTYNNEIFCFQRRGLSNILFNSRVQIPTSDGMPIEITNGLKINGKRYISNTIGCTNKWSIVESPSGLYFIDNETNSIYLFNGEIKSISDSLGMRQWVNENNTHLNWNPITYENFRGFYDKNNNDVYFVNKDWCLCYSELIGQFTSFMSYEKVPAMFNVNSEFFAFNNNKLWQQFSGEYNIFFGTYKPYSITVVANSDEPADKIFNTIEFRADAYDGDNLVPNETYDTLDVYNEYQHGKVKLIDTNGRPSSLKRKFRVWRANIPRSNTSINGISANGRDRIRNTWAYIKLSTEAPNTYKTIFHDMTIHYFV